MTGEIRTTRLRDLPEWLEDFTDNLMDTELLAPAHSSRESDVEHPVEVALPKRPKLRSLLANQNDKGFLQKTHWRSSPSCRKFGVLTMADHKVFNEECESRDNHWCAVVVQDLSTQRIPSYPCKTKTSHETERSESKFLEPSHKPKVICSDLDLGK